MKKLVPKKSPKPPKKRRKKNTKTKTAQKYKWFDSVTLSVLFQIDSIFAISKHQTDKVRFFQKAKMFSCIMDEVFPLSHIGQYRYERRYFHFLFGSSHVTRLAPMTYSKWRPWSWVHMKINNSDFAKQLVTTHNLLYDPYRLYGPGQSHFRDYMAIYGSKMQIFLVFFFLSLCAPAI